MSPNILTPQQQSVLELLKGVVLANEFYLAGGTALALQLGHRTSLDFDFFTPRPFNPESLRAQFTDLEVLQEATGTLTIVIQNVRISFFEYRYPLVHPLLESFPIPLAHVEDIAAMKISAVASRGSKKDFVDLYYILQSGYSLAEVFLFFRKKFTGIHIDEYHIMRSLLYFEDAEQEEMPEMKTPVQWGNIKLFIRGEVERLSSR
jgi:predicted nucleotidyltransferase component of viral defense system